MIAVFLSILIMLVLTENLAWLLNLREFLFFVSVLFFLVSENARRMKTDEGEFPEIKSVYNSWTLVLIHITSSECHLIYSTSPVTLPTDTSDCFWCQSGGYSVRLELYIKTYRTSKHTLKSKRREETKKEWTSMGITINSPDFEWLLLILWCSYG